MNRVALVRSAAFAALLPCLVPRGAAAETKVLGDLPRRGFLGAQIAPGDENAPPKIAKIIPGGTAEKSGLREGDEIVSLDGTETKTPQSITSAIARKRAGDSAKLHIRRGKSEKDLALKLVALPFEKSDEFDILYDVVQDGDVRMRSILTKPKGRTDRLPAMLFIQGLHCGPPDEPIGDPTTVLQLIHEVTRLGFAVMRCEKPGSGDATGPPCSEIDFHDEVEGFEAALAKLQRYDFVDPDKVFLFGHSMGGFEAPIVATKIPVRGVIVFGTGVIPWAEYLVQNERRQMRLDPAVDLATLETRTRTLSNFLHQVFREKRPIADVVKERPEFATLADEYWPDRMHSFGRHLDFYRQLDAIDESATWAQVQAPVLAIYGELDYTTCRDDHEYIAQIVNSKRPGTAEAVVLPGVFHGFNVRESVQQSLEDPWAGPLSDKLVEVTTDWLRVHLQS